MVGAENPAYDHLEVQRVAVGRPANGAGAGLPAHADELVLLRQVRPAGGEVERLWRGEELFVFLLSLLFSHFFTCTSPALEPKNH